MAKIITLDGQGFPAVEKDPGSVKTYKLDLRSEPTNPYLEVGENLAEAAWAVTGNDSALVIGDGVAVVNTPAGNVTPPAPSIDGANGIAQVSVSGGTIGVTYTLTCTFRTNATPPLVDERSIKVTIVDK